MIWTKASSGKLSCLVTGLVSFGSDGFLGQVKSMYKYACPFKYFQNLGDKLRYILVYLMIIFDDMYTESNKIR